MLSSDLGGPPNLLHQNMQLFLLFTSLAGPEAHQKIEISPQESPWVMTFLVCLQFNDARECKERREEISFNASVV